LLTKLLNLYDESKYKIDTAKATKIIKSKQNLAKSNNARKTKQRDSMGVASGAWQILP